MSTRPSIDPQSFDVVRGTTPAPIGQVAFSTTGPAITFSTSTPSFSITAGGELSATAALTALSYPVIVGWDDGVFAGAVLITVNTEAANTLKRVFSGYVPGAMVVQAVPPIVDGNTGVYDSTIYESDGTTPIAGPERWNLSASGKIEAPLTLATGDYVFKDFQNEADGVRSAAVSSTVTVARNLPVITLNGSGIVEVVLGSTYTDAGAVATDSEGNTTAVATLDSVDTNTLGPQLLAYNFTDGQGLVAATEYRSVIVVAALTSASDLQHQAQQGDVRLVHTADGGEITAVRGVVDMSGGLPEAVYLSLFGGNSDDDGRPGNGLSWWGNLVDDDTKTHYRSRTQHLLQALPATTGNLARVNDAVKLDLSWLDNTPVVRVSMPGRNQVKIEVDIDVNDSAEYLTFTSNWGSDL